MHEKYTQSRRPADRRGSQADWNPGKDRTDPGGVKDSNFGAHIEASGRTGWHAAPFRGRPAQTFQTKQMILADTSIWVSHFREGDPWLQECLSNGQILIHSFVLGEIACGNLRSRSRVLNDLSQLPFAICATDDEVLTLLEQQSLFGKGIGWIDAHLLASARLTSCQLWTLDRPLRDLARQLRVGYSGSA